MPPGRAGGRLTQAAQVDSHLSVAGSSNKHTGCLEAVAWITKFETPVGLEKKVDHLRTEEGLRDHPSEPHPHMVQFASRKSISSGVPFGGPWLMLFPTVGLHRSGILPASLILKPKPGEDTFVFTIGCGIP